MRDIGELYRDERAQKEKLEKVAGMWRVGVLLIASSLGEANPPDLSCVRLADKVLRIRDEHERAVNFLEGRGYRRCDVPACNCGSWHKQEEA
jgi:hypothetical protein